MSADRLAAALSGPPKGTVADHKVGQLWRIDASRIAAP